VMPRVTVGGAEAALLGAAISPGSAGLYQIAIRLPATLKGGDAEVRVAVNGFESPRAVNLYASPQVYSWDFDQSTEGWTAVNATSSVVQNGVWQVTPVGRDPYLIGPDIYMSAAAFKYFQVRMKGGCAGPTAVYFRTLANNSYSESRKISFTARGGADFEIY